MNYKIVTNGKRYRIQRSDNDFYTIWRTAPDGFGFPSIWQTRFYLRALKRLMKLRQTEMRRGDRWMEI